MGSLVAYIHSNLLAAQGLFEVPQPVTTAFDVQDVGAVKQSIQNGSGQDLVASQQLGPVPYRLVGRSASSAILALNWALCVRRARFFVMACSSGIAPRSVSRSSSTTFAGVQIPGPPLSSQLRPRVHQVPPAPKIRVKPHPIEDPGARWILVVPVSKSSPHQ
jgi:hypothetical protein